MAARHVVEMPHSVWILKIVELVLAVLILALTAVSTAAYAWSETVFALFTALFSIAILIYYFVAVHGASKLYNWIALLVLECLAVVFWLSAWACLATVYADINIITSYETFYVNGDLGSAYLPVTAAAMALGVIEFILYCVTLGFMGAAIHRHRTNGLPMRDGEAGTFPDAAHAESGEKNEMHNMQTPAAPQGHGGYAQQAQAHPAPPYGQPTSQDAAPQSHYAPSSIVSPYPAATPPPQNAHEVPGSNGYR